MTVSIIIPSYNRADFILDTLLSVSIQTYTNWDCYIVDDGSTDNSEYLVKNFIDEHPNQNFYWVTNKRSKGAQGARNTGLLESEGEYLIFLDSDDILDKHCLEIRMNAAIKNDEYHVYAFPVRLFNEYPGDSDLVWNILNKPHLRLLDRFLLHDAPWQTLGCLWGRDAILKIGMWDEKVTSLQDWDAHIQAVMDTNLRIWVSNDDLNFDAYYRIGSYDSISKKFSSPIGAKTNLYLVEKAVKTLKENKSLELHKSSLQRFLWIMNTLVSIADNNLGIVLYKDYHHIYELNKFKKWIYQIYINYRFDNTIPKIMRGIVSKIPVFFPINSMSVREDTCMKLTDKEVERFIQDID